MIEVLLIAEAAIVDGRWGDAGRAFRQVAEADPRNAIARVGLARVAIAELRYGDARGNLEAALVLDPDDAVARRLLDELDARDRVAPAAPPATPPARRGFVARLLGRGGR